MHTGNPPTATGDEQEVVSVYGSNRPSLQAWVESRVRLAQLMGHEDFNTVAEYYSILQTLDEELGPSGNVTGKSSRPFVKPKQTWSERTEAVKASLRRLS